MSQSKLTLQFSFQIDYNYGLETQDDGALLWPFSDSGFNWSDPVAGKEGFSLGAADVAFNRQSVWVQARASS